VARSFDVSGWFDKSHFADIITDVFQRLYSTPLKYRLAHLDRENQIFDCSYRDPRSDPIGMIKSIQPVTFISRRIFCLRVGLGPFVIFKFLRSIRASTASALSRLPTRNDGDLTGSLS